MIRKEQFKLKRKRNGTQLRIFVSKLPTSSIMRTSKKSGIIFNSFWRKFKKPAKSLKSRASILPYSWSCWKKSMMTLPHSQTNKRKNSTKMQQQLSTSWNKNSETKLFQSLKPIWKKLRSLEMTTHQEMKNKSLSNQKKAKMNLISKTKTEATGAPKISWLEESISWRRKCANKAVMMMRTENNPKTLPKKTDYKRNNKRRKKKRNNHVSTWPKFTRKNQSKLSQSSKPKPKSATWSVHSIS